ncbi:50S ribosomal protein L17 [Liquorilactobacillus mali]|uniref:Large ribosomal subunit protein bL17 n=1 Tax=Liquorilactobacillus mali KCTC 3596 = DSM 20444 TaxID=1046596 RepID=J0L5L0_9LACO|nr:50S ribosomal protein L17 [Liquorilactobacillus mali]EJE99608.1 50S ribosomal protein L17P [Liquorilactobacillus mali KCTC 3596 = DSM 20444]KRN09636.1 50S ribosomal protein L17P [Liquorilactobacillus mali KCTC 3596 = DSM 20444]MDC7952958.1 50S ribosomal protein L17 [Liquorilactobacillus mali]MDV7758410.1 50S ribosomal protein L17 [Liquorilactobacillus mali]QFQ73962.1 50S ribosomal protein L17 [Liquorilactobacillus mali]
MGYRKLGRTSEHRRAMLRNLTTDLLVNEKIVTTDARAKEVRKSAEKMISLGKKGDLASRRRAAAFLMNVVADVKEDGDNVVVQSALQKLFSDLAPRFEERNGGYTRILKMDERRGDAAKMVVLELVD